LNGVTLQILAKLDGFQKLATSADLSAILDREALELVAAFYGSRSKYILHCPTDDFVDFEANGFRYDDPRFLSDDLSTLAGLGLIALDASDDRFSKYVPTRAGAAFAARLATDIAPRDSRNGSEAV